MTTTSRAVCGNRISMVQTNTLRGDAILFRRVPGE